MGVEKTKDFNIRENWHNRMTTLMNNPRISCPWKEGDMFFQYRNSGLQNQSVIWCTKAPEKAMELDGEKGWEIFMDPNKWSKDGTVALGSLNFTEDGSMLTYTVSESGSDWKKVKFAKVTGGGVEELKDDTVNR